MKQTLIFVGLLISLSLNGQIGLRAGYGTSHFDSWEGFAYRRIDVSNASFLSSGLNLGVDYWFRLKKRRIEFMPEVGYSRFASSHVDDIHYQLSSVNAYFNVHIYPLDLAEDCDCPTFSKQGNTIKKGFFIHLSPAFRYYLQHVKSSTELNSSAAGFGFRAGAGIDIGLSDLLTLSPIVAYEKFASAPWKDLATLETPTPSDPDVSSSYSGLSGSLRLGLRFNSGRKRR